MDPIRSILVYTTGEMPADAAVARATRLAAATGASIHIVDVLAGLPEHFFKLVTEMGAAELRELAARNRRRQLDAMARVPRDADVPVTTDVVWGRPFVEITRAVVRDGFDFVFAYEEDITRMPSTPMRLIRQCPAPVWVVRPAQHAPPLKVLAAVDPSIPEHHEWQRNRNLLDFRVMEAATLIASVLDAELRVVHAWQSVDALGLELPGGVARHHVERLSRDTEARHRRWLRELLVDAAPDLPPDRVHVVEGFAGEQVIRLAQDIGADIVVMGTIRSADVAGELLGRSAERIANHCPVSIVAIKPRGFVSPLQATGG